MVHSAEVSYEQALLVWYTGAYSSLSSYSELGWKPLDTLGQIWLCVRVYNVSIVLLFIFALPIVTWTFLRPVSKPRNRTSLVVMQSSWSIIGIVASGQVESIIGTNPYHYVSFTVGLHNDFDPEPVFLRNEKLKTCMIFICFWFQQANWRGKHITNLPSNIIFRHTWVQFNFANKSSLAQHCTFWVAMYDDFSRTWAKLFWQ